MASTIKIKNSSTATAAPLVGDLVEAELAINTADKRIYTRDNSSTIVRLDGGQYTITAGTGLTGTDTVENEPTLAFDTTWGDARYASISGSNWATPRTLTVSGDASGVTAAFDGSGNITLSLTVTGGDVDSAAIADTLTGLTASFTELNYNDITTLGVVESNKTVTAGVGVIDFSSFNMSNVDIDSGTVDGVTIGAASHSTGKFTTLQATGKLTIGAEYVETTYNVTGTTPSLNPANGTIQYWTLTGNSTPTSAIQSGESITLMVADGASAYTITWPTMTWVGGSAPTLPTGGYAIITLWNVNGGIYGVHVGDA